MNKTTFGRVSGLSLYYADGLERMEIWIAKNAAGALPYVEGERTRVELSIGSEQYDAGLRATERNHYVWICADLLDARGRIRKLVEVLQANGLEKNQRIAVEQSGASLRITRA